MKRAFFNFLVLQLIVWTAVFYDGKASQDELSISENSTQLYSSRNTEEIIGHTADQSFMENKNYKRNFHAIAGIRKSNLNPASDRWKINKSEDGVTLVNKSCNCEYNILQVPQNTLSEPTSDRKYLEASVSLKNGIEYSQF